MRNIYMALLAIVVLVFVVFVVQNLGDVTVTFFTSSISLPLSVLSLLVYFLGMLTGGLMFSMFKSLARGVKKPTVK